MVSHTLTAAAHQVVHDLGKARGVFSVLRNLETIEPEFRNRAQRAVSKIENFLKHADKDPDELLEFHPQISQVYILDAVLTYEQLTGERPHLFRAFAMWLTIHAPELVKEEFREKFEAVAENPLIAKMGKLEFCSLYLSALSKKETETS